MDEPIERNFPHHFFKKSHVVDTTQVRANCVQNENSETHALCASCVLIATRRCNPNNSKLREQYSPRSLFDVNLSKGLFRLCGRHLEQNQPVGTMHRNNVDLVLILFRISFRASPPQTKSPAHTKAACAGSFFYPRGLSNTSRM